MRAILASHFSKTAAIRRTNAIGGSSSSPSPLVKINFHTAPTFSTRTTATTMRLTTTTTLGTPRAAATAAVLVLLSSTTTTTRLFTGAAAYAPNFITKIIDSSQKPPYDDAEKNRVGDAVVTTRFPPEPNGYLHLGHAKAVNFNFAVARTFGGRVHLRMDDTNPSKEDEEYVESIQDDVRWLQSDLPSLDGDDEEKEEVGKEKEPWTGPMRKTSDYFGVIYDFAVDLIKSGDAYVDSLSADEMREYRGTLTEVGKDSPYRNRSVEENLKLFEAMKNGECDEGSMVLRAKISMSSPNLNMRDPVLYRIKHESHQETGNEWCIYPMYDFSHPIADALENITHSLCTLEFEDHRPLYDWCVDKLWDTGRIAVKPRQIEFSRLNVKNTVLSKRKLITLVDTSSVSSWSDPRMPTISGLRRRGLPPSALRLFCERVGISKSDSSIDYSELENAAREVLDDVSPRAFCLLEPLKVTITNWDQGSSSLEDFEIERHPKVNMGTKVVPFGKELYIEQSDFWDVETQGKPPKGFKRLVGGDKVRLRYAYVIQCDDVVRDDDGKAIELKCSYFPETRAGVTPEGEKRVKGIIQWVEKSTAVKCVINEYDRLFTVEEPGKERDFLEDLNPASLKVYPKAVCEPSVAFDALAMLSLTRSGKAKYASDLRYQFERCGYFALDESASEKQLAFNRIVTLRDTWATPPQKNQHAAAGGRNRGGAKQKQQQQQPVEDVRRVALKVGTILSAEQHPDADALLVCRVSCGADDERTVVAGLANIFSVEELVNKKVVLLTNLKPAKMRGVESTAMLLAAEAEDEVQLLAVKESVPDGELLSFAGIEPPQPDEMLKSKGAQKVWERVRGSLTTDDEGNIVYGSESGLMTSQGKVTVALKGATIR